MSRRLLLAALSALLLVFFPSRAALGAGRQKPLTDAIDVTPGATCVETAALAEHVGAWLGADTADADVWVHVEGSPDDPRTVSFEMGRGDRTLARRRFAPGPDRCENLQAALGLAIALAIRVSLLDEIVGPREQPPPQTRPPAETHDHWAVGGGGVVALGVLPGTALGAALSLERSFPPNFALRLDLCVRFDLASQVTARACAGLLAGELLAQGRDFASSRSASSGWVAAANALGMAIGLADRWSLAGEVTLVLPLENTKAGVLSASGDVVEARDLSTVGVTMMLGPVYRF